LEEDHRFPIRQRVVRIERDLCNKVLRRYEGAVRELLTVVDRTEVRAYAMIRRDDTLGLCRGESFPLELPSHRCRSPREVVAA
jgi:hypothetical protein